MDKMLYSVEPPLCPILFHLFHPGDGQREVSISGESLFVWYHFFPFPFPNSPSRRGSLASLG